MSTVVAALMPFSDTTLPSLALLMATGMEYSDAMVGAARSREAASNQ